MKHSSIIILILEVLVFFCSIVSINGSDSLTPLTESNVTDLGSGHTPSIIERTEYVFGNLKVEAQEDGTPSPATGLYLLSQGVPLEGLVTKFRICGFLLDQDRETIPADTTEITPFVFIIAYRQMGDSYRQLYTPYPFKFVINSTDSFGCGENDIANLEWVVSKGDRIGVLIQRIQCFPFHIGPTSSMLSCPMHINLLDPVENCSQAHYFASTALMAGPDIPQELNVHDANAEGIFINLDITVGTDGDLPSEDDISTFTCAVNSPRRTASIHSIAIVLPIIFGIILVLLIILLTIGISFYCRKILSSRSQKMKAQAMVATNLDLAFATSHLQSDQHRQSQNFSDSPSTDERASYIPGSYVISCFCEEKFNNECEEGQFYDPDICERGLKIQLKKLELKEVIIENIGLREYLGSGQFGVVYRGLLQYFGSSETKEVAVKTMKNDAYEEERIKFLQEAVIMGQFNNPYVVKLYGVITSSYPYMIICELMSKGDLRRYLHIIRISGNGDNNKMGRTLLNHSREVVSAMVYLSTKGYIHRDLAARNILVSKEGICKVSNDSKVHSLLKPKASLKGPIYFPVACGNTCGTLSEKLIISDFGLSRDLQDEDYYVAESGLVPLRWTAPEALLESKFSTSSDVWSFGIVLHEIWSFALQPYKALNNKQILYQILNGYRLAPPPGCPRQVYELMIACWHPESSKRPTFSELHTSLHKTDSLLLEWSVQEKAMYSKNSRTIGAAFQEGELLHKDLHKKYEMHC